VEAEVLKDSVYIALKLLLARVLGEIGESVVSSNPALGYVLIGLSYFLKAAAVLEGAAAGAKAVLLGYMKVKG